MGTQLGTIPDVGADRGVDGEPPHRGLTAVEERLDAWANRRIARAEALGRRRCDAWLVELVAFALKQAWACVFGALLLSVLLLAHLLYPAGAPLVRDDALTLAAVAIQVLMVATRLETARELRVIVLFHLAGTAMELVKTDVGSWSYAADGVLRIAGVPLFSGFMYGAVGSYMVRVLRIVDLRFDRYPRRWVSALLAAGIYANFFTHHWFVDVRWVLVGAVLAVFGRCTLHFRAHASRHRMPLVGGFALVAGAIWLAENLATFSGAWRYPDQEAGWQPVSASKLVSWFLLMIVSVVLVAWAHEPRPPEDGRRALADRGPADASAAAGASGHHALVLRRTRSSPPGPSLRHSSTRTSAH